ncbi:MAG: hypothetical protein C5B50_26040 [Verrucomicrobia bacterium]|nr:MAG: hypothetical protein C5B50_26040 [Verrucomicrobiota bacterium]
MAVECPHCGKMTELTLAAPPQEPVIKRRTVVWTIIAGVILAGGAIALLAGSKWLQNYAARHKKGAATPSHSTLDTRYSPTNSAPVPETESAPADNGLHASEVGVEKSRDSSFVYAVGTLTNVTKRQRFGVKIELDLFDAGGEKIGTAKDYQAILEPGGQWHFKALVVDPKAVSAKVAGIRED